MNFEIIQRLIARVLGRTESAAHPSPEASESAADELPWQVAARQLQTILDHWDADQPSIPHPRNQEAENGE